MTIPPLFPRSPYWKNGHWVIDTDALDSSGHVPTHRLDQPTSRGADEPWQQYEQRVLHRTSFSPDTAQVSNLSALEPEVADSTRALLNAAQQAGIHLTPAETRRSQERQEMLFQKGRSAPGGVATWTLTSDHTPGRAVDFDGDPAAYSWLQQHAPEHGFSVMGAMDPGHVSMPGGQQSTPAQRPAPFTTGAGGTTSWGSDPNVNHGSSDTITPDPPKTPAPFTTNPFRQPPKRVSSFLASEPPVLPGPGAGQAMVQHGSSETISPDNSPVVPVRNSDRFAAETPPVLPGPSRRPSVLTGNPSEDYETTLKEWAASKVAAGANPDDVDAKVQEKLAVYKAKQAPAQTPQGESLAENIGGGLASAYQGLTMGLGNKLTAATRALLPEAMGGVKGFDYPQALKESTGQLEQFRGKHPIASTALEAAGSVPTILATAGESEIPAAAGKFRQALSMMKGGAKYGGLTGGLSANSPEDVLPGMAKGAAVGMAAAPLTAGLVGGAARGTANLARRMAPESALLKGVAESVGAGPVTGDERVSAQLSGALKRGGVLPGEAAAGLVVDQPTSMLDLGSRNVQALARQARNVPASRAGQDIDAFLSQRQAGTGNRIQGALSEATGHHATDIHLPVEELIAQRSSEAKPLYEAAKAYGEIKNPETIALVNQLKKDPVLNSAWKRGQRLAALESSGGDGAPAKPPRMDQATWDSLVPAEQAEVARTLAPSQSTKTGGPTVQQIDAWKKGLDARIESGFGSSNALSRNEAYVYRQKLRQVLDLVDTEVPAYANARQSFAGNSELKDAAEAGAKHFSSADGVTADYLQRTLPEQYPTDGEQHAYQANALNAFVAKVKNLAANPDLPEAGRGTNIVQRVMGSEDAGKRLRMLFPDEGGYQQFVSKMEQEAKYPQTNKFLTQQSSTAAQLAEGGMSPSTLRDVGMSAMGSRQALARTGMKAIQAIAGGGKMPVAVADAIGGQTTMTGQKLKDALQKMVTDESTSVYARQKIGKYLTALTASTAGNSP